MKMKEICEKQRVVTEMGSPQEWKQWWISQKFENPFAGLRPDDFEDEEFELDDEEMEELFFNKMKEWAKAKA